MERYCILSIPYVHINPSFQNDLVINIKNNFHVKKKLRNGKRNTYAVERKKIECFHATLTKSASLIIAAVCNAVRQCCSSWAVGSAPAANNTLTSSRPSIKEFQANQFQYYKTLQN